jgi:aquaporin Z
MKKLFAEFFSTWLVFGGCGSAIFASQIAPADNGQLGILLLGVSLAFGLSVLTMAYAVGHISGDTLILLFLLGFLLAVDFLLKI